MIRLATLCAIALLAPIASAFAQPSQYAPGEHLRRGDAVRASVQQRVADGIQRERLTFRSEEEARAWAFEAIAEQGTGQPRLLIEVQGKRAVRLSGEGLTDGQKTQAALQDAWNQRTAEQAPALLFVRSDNKVAAFGAALPEPGELAAKLPQLVVDPEVARPIVVAVESRKVAMPPAAGAAGAVQPPG